MRTRLPAEENTQDLVAGRDRERGDDPAPGLGDPHAPHALAAPALPVERRERRPLAVPARRHEQEHCVVPGHVSN